jgi:hypothetical protein
MTSNTAGYVNFYVDGVQQSNYIAAYSSSSISVRGTQSQTYLIPLSPGTHTFALKATLAGSGSGSLWAQGTSITYISFAQ